MSSELRTNSGFVFMDERTHQRLQDSTRGMLATLEAQRKILGQALPMLSHECPDCGQVMDRYGIRYRCVCGHVEDA